MNRSWTSLWLLLMLVCAVCGLCSQVGAMDCLSLADDDIHAVPAEPASPPAPANEAPEPAAQAADEDQLRVRIMTFNIRFGTANDGADQWRHRRRHCIDIIDQYGGDFIGLQEALHFQNSDIRDALRHYGIVGVGRDDGALEGEFCTILYDRRRWRLDEQEQGTFWLSDTPQVVRSRTWGNSIPRIVTWARFTERAAGPNGKEVWVFNTHFDHRNGESRARSAVALAMAVAGRSQPDEPVIVMGDFNEGEGGKVVRYLTGADAIDGRRSPVQLVETFRAVKPDEDEVGTFNGFRFGNTRGSKIDFIFVDAKATVHDASIIREDREERYPSDHFPVIAGVSWGISKP